MDNVIFGVMVISISAILLYAVIDAFKQINKIKDDE